VIESRISPSTWVMTGMTIRWRAFVNTVAMASTALNICVPSRKRETGIVVVEGHITPTTRVVAGATIRSKLTVMFIFVGVTRVTIRRYAFIHTIGVTRLALCSRVPTRKRETGTVMVKIHVRPFGGFMACAAIRSKLTVMVILVGMAGITIRRRALINSIGVT